MRPAGWEERLGEFLEPLRERAFAWGQHDCTTFAAGAVAAMTGEDHLVGLTGRYTTAAGALRKLRRHGWQTLGAALVAKLGEPIEPALAQRGDLVMIDDGALGALGICLGPVAAMVGQEGERPGLITMPRASWSLAWPVGR